MLRSWSRLGSVSLINANKGAIVMCILLYRETVVSNGDTVGCEGAYKDARGGETRQLSNL